MIRTLTEAIPYLEQETAAALKVYLKEEIENNLFDSDNYQYVRVCLNYEANTLQDPCLDDGINVHWFKDNEYLVMEKLFALYKYAQLTGDEDLISENWAFIRSIYENYSDIWDQEAGFFLPFGWHASVKVNYNTQITAMLAVREMASMADDSEIFSEANSRLTRMF